ncbi:cyclic nucleotide-binding domain protein (macronuclear) [Tetrahymena thermophila SB210]|uniref:Cyclic nucleotide-binding domain protein n=1 Tax=Tetrahymena thermophila (strain SB210) TaxID=312017 RepID=Q22U30_TETTS|nr:cyclic nucleotide-binding domain protein [Tetrahymena thermophila SB210]EAR88857.2 cyclic nucleotide-binding domain protein [Tetrahymena thermophila SB210]|eukprot:XP_001009102.2 cyclic nucleotide-binding domain protein [Tetrahymena thermophila SB210]
MNDSDVSSLKQRQERMRSALRQQQNQSITQQHQIYNLDDENLFMSFVEIANTNNSKQIFDKSSQYVNNQQIESIPMNNRHEEIDFNLKFDLISPNNKANFIFSDVKLEVINDAQSNQTLDNYCQNKISKQRERNSVLSNIQEINHHSISEESHQGQQNGQKNGMKSINFNSQKEKHNDQELLKTQSNGQQNDQEIQNYLKISFNKLSFMARFKVLKKFITKMKMNVRNILSKDLSESQHDIIDDKSSNYDVFIFQEQITHNQISKFFQKIIHAVSSFFKTEKFTNFISGRFLFSQGSIIRLVWDILLILLTFYLIVFIPFDHVYDFESNQFFTIFHDDIVQIILTVEIFVNLNSEIYSNGFAIQDRKIIFQKTLMKNLRDLTVLILYRISRSQQNQDNALKYFDYIVFFKYLDIPKKLNELETKLHISESAQNWLKLLKLEIIVIVLAHVAGCIYLRIGLSELGSGNNCWISQFKLNPQQTLELYLVSLYYMIISMVTIGYGDFFPTTMYERGYIIIVALIATNVCAYSFSQISEIVKFEQAKKENFNQMMRNINQQMKQNRISMILQQKVRKFHEYYYYSSTQKKDLTEKIVEYLPTQMKIEYYLEKNQQLINQVQMFKILSHKCVEQICCKIKQKILTSDEILLEQNIQNECLYFINKGSLDVYITANVKKEQYQLKKVLTLNSSEVIGYEGFLLGQQNIFLVKSQADTIVSYIEWPQFLDILKQFPDDQEKILHLRDKTLYGYPGISKLKLKCVSCSSYDHQYNECPYINYRMRYKENKDINKRQKQVRKKKLKSSTFQNLNYTQRQAMLAQINNGGSILSDAISCLNSDYEEGPENIQLRSKSCSTQSNQSEKEEISKSQAQQLLPDLKRNQSQTQKLIESSDQFLHSQQNIADIQDFKNLQTKMSLQQQQQNESPPPQKNSGRILSEINYMQGRNEVQILSRKQKASTYNQISHNRNVEFEDQNKLSSNYNKRNSKKIYDASPLSKRYSKTAETIIQQMWQQTLISPQFKKKKEKEDNQNENAQKKTPNELLLEQVFKKRKRKASKLYQLKYQQVAERLAQKKQTFFSPLDENIQKNINDLFQKNVNSQGQDQNIYNAVQILSQITPKKLKSSKLSEKGDFIKECIEKSKREFADSSAQFVKLSNQSNNSQINQNDQADNQSLLADQLILQSLAVEEAMIRTQLNIQDIDLLRVRKVYLLLQQQNKNSLNNLIEVPDNEMDIDQMKEYTFYYPNYNCNKIIRKIKNLQLKIQKQKDKINNTTNRKTKYSIKKVNRVSIPSTKASEQLFSTKLNTKNTNQHIN